MVALRRITFPQAAPPPVGARGLPGRAARPGAMSLTAGNLIKPAVLAVLLSVAPALADMLPGNARLGRQLALEVCVACHFVERGVLGTSSKRAPAFQAVANDLAVTEISLQVFFRTPHETMPNLILTEAETDNIIAYILSLR